MSFMPCRAAFTKRADHLRLVLDDLVGRADALRHVREKFVGRQHFHRDASSLQRRNPIRHTGHSCGFAAGYHLPDAGRPCGLNVDVVLRQAGAREQAQQRIKRRVLIGHHCDGFALEVGRLLDVGILPDHELHETFAAEHRDDFDRYAVLPHDDRAISQNAAERRVAGADFLGDIDAAAADRVVHFQSRLRKVAFALGELDRAEGRQDRRCRKQICELFIRARRRGSS